MLYCLRTLIYYINTNEIPGELSRENLISSHVKISPLLWLHNKSRLSHPGGVRHDPQRFMGKTVTVPHFNRDTVEFASRIKRDESNPGIKTLLPLRKRAIWKIFKIS